MTEFCTPFIVFADDWGRHPSSCQHLFGRLLDNHPAVWVNTIGTRKPRLNRDTFRRGFEKLSQWFHRVQPAGNLLPANLTVLNPPMWPWFSSRLDRWLNRRLLAGRLNAAIQSLPAPAVAVTTIPLVADLVGVLPVRRWVYYCVDDFSEWPGLDGKTLRLMERALVEKADEIVAVSEELQERIARMGRCSHLLTHGVDREFWSQPAENIVIPSLEDLERPLILFLGVIDRRMDVAFLGALTNTLKRGTLVLAGPVNEPDPALAALPRTVRLGTLPFEHLPVLAHKSAVLVMPYADLPVTRAMQPLKLKEYLATGKPVVVRELPATRPWADCLDLAATPADFVRAVTQRLELGIPESQLPARERLAGESWEEKARMFARWALEAQMIPGSRLQTA